MDTFEDNFIYENQCSKFVDFTSFLETQLNSPKTFLHPPSNEKNCNFTENHINENIESVSTFIEPSCIKTTNLCEKQLEAEENEHNIKTANEFKCSDSTNFEMLIQVETKVGRPKKNKNDCKRFVCEICAKDFKLKQQLIFHKTVHETIKSHECPECHKTFKLKVQLVTHMKIHSDIKPFFCQICEKHFRLKQQLENHYKTHSDDRPYQCTVCGKSFKFKQQLQNHSRVHDDLRPFQCDICNKKFKFKQQLQVHQKVHSNEKPFNCDQCDKSFKFKQQLQNHYKIHLRDHIDESQSTE